ncbi:MAG: hypothetical protein KDB48_09180 [Solirubrobacterales bacterium]|mgnify:CR=1 FL=1|nr:hypothetical protein [Solirubrobacterales bacterium]HMT04220.1 hypothetical protein [Solirubrobacterales bacterium]
MTIEKQEWTWPDFREPELINRLLLDDDGFLGLWLAMAASMPPRAFDEHSFKVGSGYPWARPGGSFVLDEGDGRLLSELAPDRQAEIIEEFSGTRSGRTPMLAIGSNASPEGLWRKFAHFENAADRTLLAITGRLCGFDVGASAELAFYGALPATIFASPGTEASVTALWLTHRQLTQLAWAEVPYRLGCLEAEFRFEETVDTGGQNSFDRSLVFVNRFGTFSPEGAPLALEAIPATGRRTVAADQVELLTMVARMTFGPESGAMDLVRKAFEEPGTTIPAVTEVLSRNSIPFESGRWTPFPTPEKTTGSDRAGLHD